MMKAYPSPWLVPTDGSFNRDSFSTAPPEDAPGDKACKKKLRKEIRQIDELQRRLYADDRKSLLLLFQAMDAAGKDSTIRNVFGPLNPQGCRVTGFKAPEPKELAHDYLWRVHAQSPATGEIVVFNRSHYEDVLVVRVHSLVPEERW